MIKQDFCDNWLFIKDTSDASFVRKMADGEAGIKSVTIPHDAMIYELRSENVPMGNGSGFFPGGNYLYSKKFDVPAANDVCSYILEFEGVQGFARVYLNENLICSNNYGYTGFYADLTPFIEYGKENTVAVKVLNGAIPNSRWYTGSGIVAPVNLLIGGEVFIKHNGLRIRTPVVNEDVSCVEIEIQMECKNNHYRKINICTEILDADENVIVKHNSPITLNSESPNSVHQKIYMKDVYLWSPDCPMLYTCHVQLKEEGKVLDENSSSFGLRHIQIDPFYGLRINGRPILLRGACIHHDNGPIGSASFYAAEERRIKLLKNAGFNAIRMAHGASTKALLTACDRLGVLVLEESFDMWTHSKSTYDYAMAFADSWEKDVEAIVAKDFNHPSVFMYSIGNEVQEIGRISGAVWNRKIAQYFKELDSTRPVTNAVNGLMTILDDLPKVMMEMGLVTKEQLVAMKNKKVNDGSDGNINDTMTMLMGQMNLISSHQSVRKKLEEVFDSLDVIGLNYMRDSYPLLLNENPDAVIYGSETLPPDIDLNWKLVKELPGCIGDFTWTGWDYIGESGVGIVKYNGQKGFFAPYPAYLAYVGDFDITGNRRPISYYREIVFGLRKAPFISVQDPARYYDGQFSTPWGTGHGIPSWTWPEYESKPIKVEVFSADEEVELLVNGRSVGTLPAGPEHRYKALFDICYEPGTLEVVSWNQEKAVERFMLQTAESTIKLQAELSKQRLKADNQDLVYIMISLVDKAGCLNSSKDRAVQIAVEGPGDLLGLGSADPCSLENFFDSERTTFNGRAVAVIRSRDEIGTITCRISAADCETIEVQLLSLKQG